MGGAVKLKLAQQKELEEAVRERKEIPIRFCYMGLAWHRIATDPDYTLASRELGILEEAARLVSTRIEKPVNVIHIGSGNGVEIPRIVEAIGVQNIGIYALIDINESMLGLAKSFALKKHPGLSVRTYHRNVEGAGIADIAEELKREGAERNLVLLIGNGVLFSNPQIPRFIHSAMGEKDRFFLTLELFRKEKQKEIFGSYMIPPVLDLLSIGVERAGLKPSHERFSIEYDAKDSRLKQFFQTEDGRRLLVLISYKPEEIQTIEERMAACGFGKEFMIENKDLHACAGLFSATTSS